MVFHPPVQAASLGMADSLILLMIALVVFGPRRLPQIGRQLGKLMYEFRKASNDFKFQMEEELRVAEEDERRRKEEERQKALEASAPAGAIAEPVSMPVDAPAEDSYDKDNYVESPYAVDQEQAGEPESEGAQTGEPQLEDTSSYPEEDNEPIEENGPNGPRIQPPSTGETVAARRPTAPAEPEQAAPAAEESAVPEAPSPEPEAPAAENAATPAEAEPRQEAPAAEQAAETAPAEVDAAAAAEAPRPDRNDPAKEAVSRNG